MSESKGNKTRKLTNKERAAKAPTSQHKAFAEWLVRETGFSPDPDQLAKAVQLTVTMWHQFQSSDEHKARRQQEDAEREAAKAKALQDKADKLQKQLADAKAKAAKAAKAKAAAAKVKATKVAEKAVSSK